MEKMRPAKNLSLSNFDRNIVTKVAVDNEINGSHRLSYESPGTPRTKASHKLVLLSNFPYTECL